MTLFIILTAIETAVFLATLQIKINKIARLMKYTTLLKNDNDRLAARIIELAAELETKNVLIAELEAKVVLLMGETERAKEE